MANWQVFGAVALRRLPQVIPQKDIIHLKVQEAFEAYEVAKSRLSDHELEHLNDLKGDKRDTISLNIKETAQDKEDRWSKEKLSFELAPYDERQSKIKYLFKKQKFGTDIKDQWLLPQAEYDKEKDENLLDTARRALRESFNIVNGYRIVSKIPSSLYTFRYPKKVVNLTGYKGAKVFFLKAHLDLPSPLVLKALDDLQHPELKWLTSVEASSNVNKHYMSSLSQGLLTEERVDSKRVLSRAAIYNTRRMKSSSSN